LAEYKLISKRSRLGYALAFLRRETGDRNAR